MNFFGGMPFPVQFFLAFVIVLALLGAMFWVLRRFGSGRLGSVGLRGRQPRLAVIDYASVDGRRRLILVRRDNVEHLVMIGGPTDVVVESNIVRAAPASRDVAMPRGPTMETPRAIPLPVHALLRHMPGSSRPDRCTGIPSPISGDKNPRWQLTHSSVPSDVTLTCALCFAIDGASPRVGASIGSRDHT